ncbi:hypothetical protein PoB_004182100 [Plakobranchus ocellatus]|uniref:Single domain-containing protein n=1 Tax=Plakobranchus ocellatus TaxID=259542 RepID=A0AAV4B906_9GAST|nr:hypothetical protein PoB_004182100 [Plakobranchus ocellatus]
MSCLKQTLAIMFLHSNPFSVYLLKSSSYPWSSSYTLRTKLPAEEELCCSGVLGYASDNVSSNFPCQRRPCCNDTEVHAVVSVDHALGFRFQCMAEKSIRVLCYENGVEVRTSNQDPDFVPRACCPGLMFEVVLNQWYAALVVKCVEMDRSRLRTTAAAAVSSRTRGDREAGIS